MTTLLLMKEMLEEIKTEIPLMKWERGFQDPVPLNHFTGRGAKWTVQLVTLDDGQRMGAATAGGTVMKLTDALAALAEQAARR